MYRFAAFVLARSKEYWLPNVDSHEDIIKHHDLQHLDTCRPPGLVRVELHPPVLVSDAQGDIATWKLHVGQDLLPEWTFRGDPVLEERTRKAMLRRIAESSDQKRWFARRDAGDMTTVTVGNYSVIEVGDYNVIEAGRHSTVRTGKRSVVRAGRKATVTVGYGSVVTLGDHGVVLAGDQSSVAAGDYSSVRTGCYSHVIAGRQSTVSITHAGTAEVGDGGTVVISTGSRAAAGLGGVLVASYRESRGAVLTARVGEDGILPHVLYEVRDGRWVQAEE